ncbi:MAG: ribosome silencing factor [Pseudomonadota bacterium]
MDIRKLQRAIVDGLEDVKAQNIVVFDTEAMSPLFERVIIASGTSNRQTKALASSVRETVKERGMQVLRTEGEDNGEWIIVDCGAAVAHIMQPAIREYYHLEEIWGGKPVRMKKGAAPAAAPQARLSAAPGKAASVDAAGTATTANAAPKAGAKRAAPAVKKTAAKTATKAAPKAATKTATKTAATAAGKVAAKTGARTLTKPPPARRTASGGAPAAKAPSARSRAGAGAPAKTAAPKSGVRKTAVRKTVRS